MADAFESPSPIEAAVSDTRIPPPMPAGPPCRIVVMARAPQPGQTKKRLIPAIGAERAAALHRAMIRHAVDVARASGIGGVELWCTPDPDHAAFADFKSLPGLKWYRQQGPDLGARMSGALGAASGPGVVIGTDCPFLHPSDFIECARCLRNDRIDAVIVPAFDGGYVLIASARPQPALFVDIDWGSDRVLDQTRKRARTAGLCLHELAPKRDIDRPEDLRFLAASDRFAPFAFGSLDQGA
ncbi:TIGR04282 family arsenosugar biosynthesis glycosyltransferase [Thioalkalivibrio sp. HK1]|uniref:TIGR04282 family arsenosugar biosynthesis glycosyltransferase n=1 Tax=Thioalkalivibrio sp. HK1 TaxID=1469245 RepID=UPI0004B092FE|nr:TIGR04282 family arsenosugar biosynthesis glycosyltransferase [Thioalkalivibrio sp. HK1]